MKQRDIERIEIVYMKTLRRASWREAWRYRQSLFENAHRDREYFSRVVSMVVFELGGIFGVGF
jgi:hypothetical protein